LKGKQGGVIKFQKEEDMKRGLVPIVFCLLLMVTLFLFSTFFTKEATAQTKFLSSV
jgi:hypothetical protein